MRPLPRKPPRATASGDGVAHSIHARGVAGYCREQGRHRNSIHPWGPPIRRKPTPEILYASSVTHPDSPPAKAGTTEEPGKAGTTDVASAAKVWHDRVGQRQRDERRDRKHPNTTSPPQEHAVSEPRRRRFRRDVRGVAQGEALRAGADHRRHDRRDRAGRRLRERRRQGRGRDRPRRAERRRRRPGGRGRRPHPGDGRIDRRRADALAEVGARGRDRRGSSRTRSAPAFPWRARSNAA